MSVRYLTMEDMQTLALTINGYEFRCPPEQLETTVVRVAESASADNKAMQRELIDWLSHCIKPIAE